MAIILASSSPARRALLENVGLPIEVVVPGIDETPQTGETPEALVRRLSLEKGAHVHERHPDAIVISGDQVAAFAGKIIGKPHDRAVSRRQLLSFSNKTITFYSGICVHFPTSSAAHLDCVLTQVHFRHLTEQMVDTYLDHANALECAAGLKVEAQGIALIRGIESSDPNALIGLSLIRLADFFEAEGQALIAYCAKAN